MNVSCLPTCKHFAAPSPARVLGIPLADLVAKDGIPVPFIVKKIVRHVEDFGLDQVGIYRINGNVKVIEKLRESFDKGTLKCTNTP